MAEEFEAVRYAADGHAGEQDPIPGRTDGEIVARGTLAECVERIAALCGHGWSGRCWPGTGDDVEAYHESADEGCGGWAIRRA